MIKMQDMKQIDSEIRELTDAELDAIDGGSFFGRIANFLHSIFNGPGDHRRPLDRP